MTYEPIIIAAIVSVAPTLVGIATLRQSKQTHLAINSRMDALLTAAKIIARAEGKAEGKAEGRAEGKENPYH